MATITRHKATVVRSAPNVSASIYAMGGDPLTQTYDEASGQFIPDRTVLPLTLDVKVLSDGKDVGADVTNQSWWMVNADGTQTQVTTSTAAHELVSTVVPMRLKVKRNIAGGSAAEYVYRYTQGGIESAATVSLDTIINAAPAPELELDCANALAWDPFSPSAEDWMTIRPTVRAYGRTGLTVRWRKKDGATTRDILWNDPLDIELRQDGQNLKVNRRWMGESVAVVCELLSGSTVIRTVPVTMRRRIPELKVTLNESEVYSDQDSTVHAALEVKSGGKILGDPSKELLICWYEGSSEVGRGNSHDYSVKGKSEIDTGYSVADRGPLNMLKVGNAYLRVGTDTYVMGR